MDTRIEEHDIIGISNIGDGHVVVTYRTVTDYYWACSCSVVTEGGKQ
jgi:hypothetical protein